MPLCTVFLRDESSWDEPHLGRDERHRSDHSHPESCAGILRTAWVQSSRPHRFARPVKKASLLSAPIAGICCVTGACTTSSDGDVVAGKRFFEEQCIDCHVAEPGDAGGVQGPSLVGLIGRSAGSDTNFPYYTQPMRESGLTWDATSLDRFLAAPEQTVPGTAMVLAVAKPEDRQNLIAYFMRAAANGRAAHPASDSQ